MSRIGEKIKEARLKQNMAVKQLAKKCGVSESYITDIESGKKVISDVMIKRISSILNTSLDESQYREDLPEETERAAHRAAPASMSAPVGATRRVALDHRDIAPEWQSAFTNVIRDIPIYDINMAKVTGHKHLPVIDKKVEGYNPDKLVFISIPDNSLSGFRVKKGDLVMVVLNPEPLNNGLCLMEYDGARTIKLVKRLDGDRILLLSNPDEIKAETKHLKEIKILGHCIRAEINL